MKKLFFILLILFYSCEDEYMFQYNENYTEETNNYKEKMHESYPTDSINEQRELKKNRLDYHD